MWLFIEEGIMFGLGSLPHYAWGAIARQQKVIEAMEAMASQDLDQALQLIQRLFDAIEALPHQVIGQSVPWSVWWFGCIKYYQYIFGTHTHPCTRVLCVSLSSFICLLFPCNLFFESSCQAQKHDVVAVSLSVSLMFWWFLTPLLEYLQKSAQRRANIPVIGLNGIQIIPGRWTAA